MQGDAPDLAVPIEFLNKLTLSGMPPHQLYLFRGMVLLLLRNLDPSMGLCNGTRLVLLEATQTTLKCIIISEGAFLGHFVLIPRVKTTSSDSGLPFQLQRTQFPVIIAWAMTINKSQGQTLTTCGLYLDTPIFSHGQLYVAFSRASAIRNIAVLSFNSYIPSLRAHVVCNIVHLSILHACGIAQPSSPSMGSFPLANIRGTNSTGDRAPGPAGCHSAPGPAGGCSATGTARA
jgi:hypothetical protein